MAVGETEGDDLGWGQGIWNTRREAGSLREGVGRGGTGQVGGALARKHACRLTGETTKGAACLPAGPSLWCLQTACRKEGKAGIQRRLKEPKFRSDMQGDAKKSTRDSLSLCNMALQRHLQ